MEESIKYLKEQFDLQPVDIRTYSPVVLAYIGDAVYELVIRTILVDQGNRQANTLHKGEYLCQGICTGCHGRSISSGTDGGGAFLF